MKRVALTPAVTLPPRRRTKPAIVQKWRGCIFGALFGMLVVGQAGAQAIVGARSGSDTTKKAAAASTSAAVNYQGLYWNAPAGSESGWGINVAHQGDVIFATWFTYDATGKALWLSMTANRTAEGVYAGAIYQTQGPAFSATPFSPAAVTATEVGMGTLTFGDVDNGSFAYVVNGIAQTKTITRQVFGPVPVCVFGGQSDLALATNYQDLWWAAPAGVESGWGVNFTHQGDIIFATWFTYDGDGMPLWLSATVNKTGPGVYTGTLYRTTGPAFNAVPFLPANVGLTAMGPLTLTFANGNSATFAYTVNGVTQTKSIVRQVFRTPGTVCRAGTTLPPLSDDPIPRLRGATFLEWLDWSDPGLDAWKHVDEFPRWGGNVVSLVIKPFFFGEPVLPGQPLSARLMKVLERSTTLIDWALQHNMHVNLRFHQINAFPAPFRIWPDDGRILWTDASAQQELIQAWADLARHFKGRKGIIFNLLTEPAPWPNGVPQALVYKTWNVLYPRLIEAIRAQDPERWIIVEPLYGDSRNFAASSLGWGFPDLVVSKDPKVMYEFHFYEPTFFSFQGQGGSFPPAGSVAYPGLSRGASWEPEVFWDKSVLEQRLRPAIDFRDTHHVRVMAGEFGSPYLVPDDSRARWLADIVDLLETHGFDWAYFEYEAGNCCVPGTQHGAWNIEGTVFEDLVTSRFGLNLR